MESLCIVRAPAAELDRLPQDAVLARQSGACGPSALVRGPEAARRLLPGAVVDPIHLDEMMQFYAGREEEA